MTFKATLDADLFRRANMAASTEETRYYLNGVLIEAHPSGIGALLVATDGHVMLMFYDATAVVEESAIVKLPKHLFAACKPGKKGPDPVLYIDGDNAEVVDSKGTPQLARGVLIDGAFPNWRRVLPTLDPNKAGCHGSFDARYVATLGAALSAGETHGLRIMGNDALDPHLVRGTHASGFGVIMPMQNIDAYVQPFEI